MWKLRLTLLRFMKSFFPFFFFFLFWWISFSLEGSFSGFVLMRNVAKSFCGRNLWTVFEYYKAYEKGISGPECPFTWFPGSQETLISFCHTRLIFYASFAKCWNLFFGYDCWDVFLCLLIIEYVNEKNEKIIGKKVKASNSKFNK